MLGTHDSKTVVEVAEIVRDFGIVKGLRSLEKRFGAHVEGPVAAGIVKAAFVDLKDADALADAWIRVVDVLNVPLYQEWKDDTAAAIEQIKGRVKYTRLDEHGPKLGPITKEMKLWTEEQFGPIMPIASFKNLSEPLDWLAENHFGLQSCVFGYDPQELSQVVDTMAYQVGRVNVNSPDKRGPDVLPFGGKKDSGMGVTNAREAVKGFTVETVVATMVSDSRNVPALQGLEGVSRVVKGTGGIRV